MDKVLITDLQANGVIGVEEAEREHSQDVLINVCLYTDIHAAGLSDSITDTINYTAVSKLILAEVSATSFRTVEALATHLARLVLQNFPVDKLDIRVEKPNRVKYALRVGVEISRTRSDFNF